MAVPAFRLTTRTREASASPSVSLEKGRHRIRAPRPTFLQENSKSSGSRRRPQSSADRNNLYLAVLLSLLIFASLGSFGAAYYLYKYRWSLSFEVGLRRAERFAPVIEVDPRIVDCPRIYSPHPKYMSYLPHSGFHNQRIALENALTLSSILNRTLLIPPIRLGKPLRYGKYDSLYSHVALSGKEGLTHCSKASTNLPLPSECFDYFDYTFLSWESLVDFAAINARQYTIARWNLTDSWIHQCLNISSSDTRVLKDSSRYHFQFRDDASSTQYGKYSENIDISTLASFPEPLLQIGTLFGTSRLHLARPENRRIRSRIREDFLLNNPYLTLVADLVASSLGDSYLGVHVRLGDGQFRANATASARAVWLSLLRDEIGLSVDDALALEKEVSIHGYVKRLLLRNQGFLGQISSHLQCRRERYTEPHLMPLNVPLYIATDAKDPTRDPLLALFFNTFPCAFYLGDFLGRLTVLDQLENLYDGIKLKTFLLPFVDAMIVGKARRAIGSPGSTFSTYITDVLWPKYHDSGISERG